MIKLENIDLQRGSKMLLQQASATFYPGQKTALIGSNGSGKSSLFQVLLGELQVDSGNAEVPAQWQIAHMAQEVAASDRKALDYVLDGDVQLRAIEHQIARAEANDDYDALANWHEKLDGIDGYNAAVRAEKLMLGLGFRHGDINKETSSFSGGWRIRLNLAQALMSPSDLLLLDEPTNHLDLDAELWLEQWLQRYQGSLVLISHDRDFIDAVCEGIVHIDQQRLQFYRGNYSAFERQRAERLAQQQANYEKQQQRKKEIHSFVSRFRAKATKAKQAQSRLKELQRMEDIAPAHIDSPFNFSFPVPDKVPDPLLNLSRASMGYGASEILQEVNLGIHPGSRIGLLGANGAGKSTLVKTLAGDLDLLSGEFVRGENLQLGYFSQHQLEALDLDASPALHLQRLRPTASDQQIRNFLGGFNFRGDMALDTIRLFSGGEKARLALAIVVWQKPGLLLLDEPTNHLDLEMCHALTVALQAYDGAVLVISHDRHLLKNTVDQFLLVANGRVQAFDGDLNDYSQWLKTQDKNRLADEQEGQLKKTDKLSKKEQRQQSAERRKRQASLTNAIKKTEKSIDQNAMALSEIEQALVQSDMYDDANKAELQRLLQEQGRLTQQGNVFEEHWLELNEQLHQLETGQ